MRARDFFRTAGDITRRKVAKRDKATIAMVKRQVAAFDVEVLYAMCDRYVREYP